MNSLASQVTSLTLVYSTVYSGANQRKHRSSASLAFVLGNYPWPVNSPHKGPVTRKMFRFDDFIMTPTVGTLLWFVGIGRVVPVLQCLHALGQSYEETRRIWIHQSQEFTNSCRYHYITVIMSAIASQITGVSIVCSAVCSGADQRKHQSSMSLTFVRGIHRWPVDSPHKGPVTRKTFPFDEFIMWPWPCQQRPTVFMSPGIEAIESALKSNNWILRESRFYISWCYPQRTQEVIITSFYVKTTSQYRFNIMMMLLLRLVSSVLSTCMTFIASF